MTNLTYSGDSNFKSEENVKNNDDTVKKIIDVSYHKTHKLNYESYWV